MPECELVDDSTTVNGVTISVKKGTLVQERVDAIAYSANPKLQLSTGVAGIIKSSAGSEIVRETKSWIKQNGEVPVGGVAFTTAGLLPS
jgi:O-acetyl-ADP-ribose deacetylase (regulator of RNase III)